MSILGSLEPKFTDGVNTVYISYMFDFIIEDQNREFSNESVVNFNRDFEGFGVHKKITIKIYLWKFEAAAEIYFNTVKAYEHTDVYLYRHLDGDSYKNYSDTNVLFYVSRVYTELFDVLDPLQRDILIIEFYSKQPIKD